MTAPRTWWNVSHSEHPARLVVAAPSDNEARALASTRWYRRAPRNELKPLIRAAYLRQERRGAGTCVVLSEPRAHEHCRCDVRKGVV